MADTEDSVRTVTFDYRGRSVTYAITGPGDYVCDFMAAEKTFPSPGLWNQLLPLVPYSPVVIDAGAHVGGVTMWFSRVCCARKVIAIEADSYNFSLLQRTIALSGDSDVVTPLNVAVGATCGFSRVAAFSSNNSGGIMFTQCNEGDADSVKLVTIDSIVSENKLDRVDVIKIDVEGAECDAVIGAANTIMRFHPVIAVELWVPGIVPVDPHHDTVDAFIKFIQLMSDNGYVLAKKLDADNYIFTYKGL